MVIFFQEGTTSHLDNFAFSLTREIEMEIVFKVNIECQTLTFKKVGEQFFDLETNSGWTITGKCIAASLKAKQLQIKLHSNHLAFWWMKIHSHSESIHIIRFFRCLTLLCH